MSIEWDGYLGEAWCSECDRVFGTGEYEKAKQHECES